MVSCGIVNTKELLGMRLGRGWHIKICYTVTTLFVKLILGKCTFFDFHWCTRNYMLVHIVFITLFEPAKFVSLYHWVATRRDMQTGPQVYVRDC